MANISLYDPMLDRLNKLFNNFPWRPALQDFYSEGHSLQLDVIESDQNYVVRTNLPGIKKEDIKIQIDGNQISISAEIKHAKEETGQHVVCTERYEGRVFRSFTLDVAVDAAVAQAKYADGVLELTLPKKPDGTARRIDIQ